jgi:hypothetical protein
VIQLVGDANAESAPPTVTNGRIALEVCCNPNASDRALRAD